VSSQLDDNPLEEDNENHGRNRKECGQDSNSRSNSGSNGGSQGVVNSLGTNCDEVGEDEQLRQTLLQSKGEAKTASWIAWKKTRELDPAMDCLINAHLRNMIQC